MDEDITKDVSQVLSQFMESDVEQATQQILSAIESRCVTKVEVLHIIRTYQENMAPPSIGADNLNGIQFARERALHLKTMTIGQLIAYLSKLFKV